MMPLPDHSLKGVIVPYPDGSGWTGVDSLGARLNGWNLEIERFDIIPAYELYKVTPVTLYPIGNPVKREEMERMQRVTEEHLPILIERALAGDRLSYKALFLMAYNDTRFREHVPLVEALREQYV